MSFWKVIFTEQSDWHVLSLCNRTSFSAAQREKKAKRAVKFCNILTQWPQSRAKRINPSHLYWMNRYPEGNGVAAVALRLSSVLPCRSLYLHWMHFSYYITHSPTGRPIPHPFPASIHFEPPWHLPVFTYCVVPKQPSPPVLLDLRALRSVDILVRWYGAPWYE